MRGGGSDTTLRIETPSLEHMPHDEGFVMYDGSTNPLGYHALDRFIRARRLPTVMQLTGETADKIFDASSAGTPILSLIRGYDPESQCYEKVVTEVSKNLRGRVLVCSSGVESQVEKRVVDMLGVEDQVPVLVLCKSRRIRATIRAPTLRRGSIGSTRRTYARRGS